MGRILLVLVLAAVSSIAKGQQGIEPPAAPEIVHVTVDTASGMAEIKWNPLPDPDIAKYVVYYFKPGISGALAIDTVGRDTTKYFYENIDPSLSAQTMTVTAVDTLGTVGILPDPPHRTMFLTTSYDSCQKSMELEWSSYRGWANLVRYETYYSVDGSPYTLLDQNSPEDSTMFHLGLEENREYCYFVKAINPETQSFSNISCRNITHPLHPKWINAESASVLGSDLVEVKFVIDPESEVSSFQLYKNTGSDKPFLSDAVFRDVSDSLMHMDPVISTDKKYQYKLYSLDVCDNAYLESGSNICGNMVLSVSSAGLEASLSWNPYMDYEAGVKGYRIYRDVNRSGDPLPVGGVNHPDTTWENDLSFLSSQEIEDEICYYVVAEENEDFTRGNRGFSRSNKACVTVVPEILMANAIIPNGGEPNNEIKPELTFLPLQYLFVVYDRWGNRVFETQEHTEPWEGRIKGGDYVPEGAYAYYIKLTTSNGIEVIKKGVITVFYK